MIVDFSRQEHRNIEKLLLVLEPELEVFDRGERSDYEVIQAVISYFEVYPDAYHHPQEDWVFAETESARSRRRCKHRRSRGRAQERRRVARAVQSVLMDREVLRQIDIIRDFIAHERHHIAMEET